MTGNEAKSVDNYKCPTCGSAKIEEITRGARVADVVGVTLDDGLVCNLVTFTPDGTDYAKYYRCKNCLKVLPFTTDSLVEHLRGK